ncbi:hypothetical protein ABH927_001977 [Planotetraspora sp. GP83]
MSRRPGIQRERGVQRIALPMAPAAATSAQASPNTAQAMTVRGVTAPSSDRDRPLLSPYWLMAAIPGARENSPL